MSSALIWAPWCALSLGGLAYLEAFGLVLLLDFLKDMRETLVCRVQDVLDTLLLLLVELLYGFGALSWLRDAMATQIASIVTRGQNLLYFNSILARVTASSDFDFSLL